MILFHLQFLIGIAMLVFSPGLKAALESGTLMSDSYNRVTFVEHPFSMLVAAILLTIINNYYQDELEYQKVIDAKKNADQLSQKPFFAQLPYGIRIAFPKETIDAGQQVHFELYSTNDKEKDKKQNVNLDNNNSFLVPKEMLSTGSYTLKVRWKKSDIDYQVDYELVWK
jgi:hypothetical protein